MAYQSAALARLAPLLTALTLIATMMAIDVSTMGGARADDEAKYPSWKGQWIAIVTPGLEGRQFKFDPTKSRGLAQGAPLTAEYQTVLAESLAEQAKGGRGNYPTARCLPGGMPRMMATQAQEYIITPETTYILLGGEDPVRRIYTDGRDWPGDIEPTYQGYAIGEWRDPDAQGRYTLLAVETRGFKGPRAYDSSGLPLAFDNQSVFKERFHLDKADILHDEITVYDHALTRPWSVDKTFRRNPNPRPKWNETSCVEGNNQVVIGKENYFLSADGNLMPTKKDQPPPDLKYFKPPSK
ncbi:MAG TPA: hypothetical protein VIY51_20095 [Xanthobacteraceae bacterium]